MKLKFTYLALLLALPTLAGCLAAAVGVATIVVAEEHIDNATHIIVPRTVEMSWATAKSTLSEMSTEPLEVDDSLRALIADYDNSQVVVEVKRRSMQSAELIVSARKYGFHNSDIVNVVVSRIEKNLGL